MRRKLSELDVQLIRLDHVVSRIWLVSSFRTMCLGRRKDETSKLLCCDMLHACLSPSTLAHHCLGATSTNHASPARIAFSPPLDQPSIIIV